MQTDEIRRFLERMAADAREPSSVPPKLGRRALRRRARTVIAGIMALGLIGFGSVAGVHAFTAGKAVPAAVVPCSWNVVDSPNHEVAKYDNSLQDVAAISDEDVWAVGSYAQRNEGGFEAPLLLHWDGTSWSESDAPPMEGRPYLQGVTAISSDDVWAVGYREGVGPDTQGPLPLALHWDGSRWSMVPVADSGTPYSGFTSVAGTASDDVWAVGFTSTGEKGGTLAEHWDGTAWTVVSTPNPPPDPLTSLPYPRLDGVTAISADDVWAVGARENVAPMQGSNTLALHWDGERWSVVPSPDVPSLDGPPVDMLVGVSASGPDDVWAVGSYALHPDTNLPSDRTLVLHWDGDAWKVVDTPSIDGRNWAEGVASLSPTSVSVVGGRWTGEAAQPLVERWDGKTWSALDEPVQGWASLSGVAASPSGDLWAVGNRTMDQNTGTTLVMRCS